ncbi:hypothetical protein [Persicobacter sp. CCB-QB2]|uniref:hypothetical protein n=1 Tax=Persicobacter sp. CCB-QB2 TaxID=1561025 RepID=UPI0012FB4D4B|nr:hypothetical protein [Persicobacter sp. CCB-QB2]
MESNLISVIGGYLLPKCIKKLSYIMDDHSLLILKTYSLLLRLLTYSVDGCRERVENLMMKFMF